MDFSLSDINRLYGDRFFLVPESETPAQADALPESVPDPAPPIHLLNGQQSIIWKMKPAAKMVVILRKAEFLEKAFTAILKEEIDSVGISTSAVGFGILEDQAKDCNLSDLKLDYALICTNFGVEWPSSVIVEKKQIWLSASLSEIHQKTDLRDQLRNALLDIKHKM